MNYQPSCSTQDLANYQPEHPSDSAASRDSQFLFLDQEEAPLPVSSPSTTNLDPERRSSSSFDNVSNSSNHGNAGSTSSHTVKEEKEETRRDKRKPHKSKGKPRVKHQDGDRDRRREHKKRESRTSIRTGSEKEQKEGRKRSRHADETDKKHTSSRRHHLPGKDSSRPPRDNSLENNGDGNHGNADSRPKQFLTRTLSSGSGGSTTDLRARLAGVKDNTDPRHERRYFTKEELAGMSATNLITLAKQGGGYDKLANQRGGYDTLAKQGGGYDPQAETGTQAEVEGLGEPEVETRRRHSRSRRHDHEKVSADQTSRRHDQDRVSTDHHGNHGNHGNADSTDQTLRRYDSTSEKQLRRERKRLKHPQVCGNS